MISVASSDKTFDFRCLSTDTKPVDYNGVEIKNGSTLLEMDTGDVYLYDEENKLWRKFA